MNFEKDLFVAEQVKLSLTEWGVSLQLDPLEDYEVRLLGKSNQWEGNIKKKERKVMNNLELIEKGNKWDRKRMNEDMLKGIEWDEKEKQYIEIEEL